jgi:peptidoglycan hydrolase-like protein with peptidoglycan-binding domain
MALLFVLVYFLFLQDSSDGGVAIESATTTVPAATTTPPVTAVPAATPTTVGAAPAPQPTAAPLVIAPCVTALIDESTNRGEVALYQQTLKNLGYDPGGVDGFFGPKTTDAAFAEINDNGSLAEIFPDPPVAILFSAFQRLGIACP